MGSGSLRGASSNGALAGFEVVPRAQLSPALTAVVDDETRRGLDPASRVGMQRSSQADQVDLARR
jgi:hypothetical protein